ncbi:MAG TPA: hypothetical protein VHF69_07875 [Candidatus Synoicihabitans sp.]|nr:hypothetical protein [Candidatus Synoicihabitans sp.]
MAISPWVDAASAESPDGRFVAIYDQAGEVAMGGPTAGRLVIKSRESGKRVAEYTDAGASFVWSADSSAVAFPRWTFDRMQHLAVLKLAPKELTTLNGLYSVLQLHSFSDGVIVGIDSPIHCPREVRVRAFDHA